MGSFKSSKTGKKNLRLQRRFAIHLNGRKLAPRWTVAITRVSVPARSAPARAATILGGDKRVSSLTTTRHRFLVARFARDNFSTIGLVFRGYPLFGLCQPGVFSRWHFVCIRLSQSAFVSMRDGDQTKKKKCLLFSKHPRCTVSSSRCHAMGLEHKSPQIGKHRPKFEI